MLKLVLIIGGFFVVIGVLFVVVKLVLPDEDEKEPIQSDSDRLEYVKQRWLLTKAERSFLGVLQHVAGSEFMICPKVRLADLIAVKRGASNRQRLWNRIQSKHVDFVLCSIDTVEPRVAIELNDASHQREDRKKRDEFLESALAAADLPFVAIRAQQAYAPAEIRAAIDGALT